MRYSIIADRYFCLAAFSLRYGITYDTMDLAGLYESDLAKFYVKGSFYAV
jgi:hypothetical protein